MTIPYSCVITAPNASSLLAKLGDLQLLTLDGQGRPAFVNCVAQVLPASTDPADTRAHAFVALQLADAAAVTAFEAAVSAEMLNLPDAPQIGVAGWAPPKPQSYEVADIKWALSRRKNAAGVSHSVAWAAGLAALKTEEDGIDALASPTAAQTRRAEAIERALLLWNSRQRILGTEPWFMRLVAAYRVQAGLNAAQTETWLAATLARALLAPED
jgi:hypothetical protein